MTSVAIYFSNPDPEGPPFNKASGSYRRGYLELARDIEAMGGLCRFVRGKDSFLGNGEFSKCYRPLPDGSLLAENGLFRADVVLNKGEDLTFDDGTTVVNDPAFHAFCNDKPATYARFSDISPMSVVVRQASELEDALSSIPGGVVVAKPTEGAGSKGVVIGTRDVILAAEHTYPIVVQEWIDSSAGIPGICDGRHDLRVIIVGGTVALAALKIPKDGDLVYGLEHGGSFRVLDENEYPSDALDVVRRIDGALSSYPARYYSADIARRSDGRWFLIELNSPPGMNEEAEHPSVRREHRLIAEALLTAARTA